MVMREGCIEEKLYDNRPLCIQSEYAAVVNDSARQALQPTDEKSNSHPPISRVNKSTQCNQHVMLADAITQRVSERGVRNSGYNKFQCNGHWKGER